MNTSHGWAQTLGDDICSTDLATLVVTVNHENRPPVADANGPYVLDEGADLVLDSSGSYDPDAAYGDSIVLYAWDLDSDGEYDDAAGETPTVPWTTLEVLGLTGGTHSIELQVEDGFGGTSTATTTLTINAANDAPVAASQ